MVSVDETVDLPRSHVIGGMLKRGLEDLLTAIRLMAGSRCGSSLAGRTESAGVGDLDDGCARVGPNRADGDVVR